MKNSINLDMKQNLILSQELIYSISLLKLNNNDLLEEMKKISEKNVFIDLKEKNQTYFGDYKDRNIAVKDNNQDFRYDLLREFRLLTSNYKDIKLAEYIIFSLDKRGFFMGDLDYISKKFKVDINYVNEIIEKIKRIKMQGLGSRSIKDFLIFQAKDEDLKKFLNLYYDKLISMDINKLAKNSEFSIDRIIEFIDDLKSLKLYPLEGYEGKDNYRDRIIDLVVEIDDDKVSVSLNSIFDFKINSDYVELIPKVDKDAKTYLLNDYNQARFIEKAIEERNKNLVKIASEIVTYHRSFFVKNESLKILSMEMVAELTGLSISTVSRAVFDKNIFYNGKVYQLRDFFVSGIKKDGYSYSSDEIKRLIAKLIKMEDFDKVKSDKEICENLNRKGIPIKRRTVTKYREELKIPNTWQRKNLYLINKDK